MMFNDPILQEIKHISVAVSEELTYIKGRQDGTITSLRTPWEKYNNASMAGVEFGTIHCCAGMSGRKSFASL